MRKLVESLNVSGQATADMVARRPASTFDNLSPSVPKEKALLASMGWDEFKHGVGAGITAIEHTNSRRRRTAGNRAARWSSR